MTREQARAELLTREPDFLNQARQKANGHPTYICPVCGNGKGKDGDGIALNVNSKSDFPHWHCFGCGLEADILELWMKHNQISDYAEAFRTAYDYYGIQQENTSGILDWNSEISDSTPIEARTSPVQTFQQENHETIPMNQDGAKNSIRSDLNGIAEKGMFEQSVKAESEPDYTDFFLQANQNLMKTDYHRGISLDTLNRFKVGYVEHWRHPKAPDSVPASPRLIIPTSKNSYIARDTRQSLTDAEKRYSKSKAGNVHIFNLSALWKSDRPVFIVEGEIDAMSICDVGGEAAGIGSTSMIGKLIETLRNAKQKPAQPLIIALDNDKAGQEATAKLSEGLDKLNIRYIIQDISGECKDANELLMKDRQSLSAKIRIAMQLARKPYNVQGYIDLLMGGEIKQFRTFKDRKTGFSNLDAEAGGLYPGLYCIAATSSLGKTTFCHQMADNLAMMGEDVIFFSMEQSRLELVTKSIARETAKQNMKTAVTSLSIRKGYLPEHVQKAAKKYHDAISDRLSIIEGNFKCNVDFMKDYIKQHIQLTDCKPVVFVDYLQILQPVGDKRQTTKEVIDNTVTELKRISRDLDLTIFIISSVNRTNYLTPIDFESLKESGGIEYTCDVIYGLQLQCLNSDLFNNPVGKIKEKRKKIRESKAENPRKIELVCLKNRYGISNFSCYFDYYPANDLFVEGNLDARYIDNSDTIKKAGRKL